MRKLLKLNIPMIDDVAKTVIQHLWADYRAMSEDDRPEKYYL